MSAEARDREKQGMDCAGKKVTQWSSYDEKWWWAGDANELWSSTVLGEEVELGSNRREDGESEAKELQERWRRVELEVSIE
jgi:hypothetical protein